jgi:hypothetical protein
MLKFVFNKNEQSNVFFWFPENVSTGITKLFLWQVVETLLSPHVT